MVLHKLSSHTHWHTLIQKGLRRRRWKRLVESLPPQAVKPCIWHCGKTGGRRLVKGERRWPSGIHPLILLNLWLTVTAAGSEDPLQCRYDASPYRPRQVCHTTVGPGTQSYSRSYTSTSTSNSHLCSSVSDRSASIQLKIRHWHNARARKHTHTHRHRRAREPAAVWRGCGWGWVGWGGDVPSARQKLHSAGTDKHVIYWQLCRESLLATKIATLLLIG